MRRLLPTLAGDRWGPGCHKAVQAAGNGALTSVVRQLLPTSGAHSHGSATPHSHIEYRMGRPVALSASRMAVYLSTTQSEAGAKQLSYFK